MASRNMLKLTDCQRDVIQAISKKPGEWLTSKDIYDCMCSEFGSCDIDSSHIGSLMRRLPQKDSRVEIDDSTATTRYRWIDYVAGFGDNPDNYKLPPAAQPDCDDPIKPVTSPPVNRNNRQSDDGSMIIEALMYFANGIVATDSTKALRAAFLAGQIGKKKPATPSLWNGVPAVQHKSQNKVAVTETAEPDINEAARIPAIMPDDMSYREMVDKIQAAYKRCEFLYADAAKRAELGEDYFTRIAQGKVAQPPRATQERVYSAIFEDDSNGDFDDA